MKESQKLIISLLDAIACKFGEMSFTYMYSYSTNQHLVEVTPEGSYNSDAYLIAESDLISDFIKEYPCEGLLFVCNDPYIKVVDPIHYAKKGAVKYFTQLPLNEVDVHKKSVSLQGELNIIGSIADVFKNVRISEGLGKCELKPDAKWENQDVFAGDNTYAMAA